MSQEDDVGFESEEFGECLERALAIFPTSLTLNSHSFPFLLRFPYGLLERALFPP